MKTKGYKDSKDDVKLTSFSTEDAGKNNVESINYAQKHDVQREAGSVPGNSMMPAVHENELRGNGSKTTKSTTQSLSAFCFDVSLGGVRYGEYVVVIVPPVCVGAAGTFRRGVHRVPDPESNSILLQSSGERRHSR